MKTEKAMNRKNYFIFLVCTFIVISIMFFSCKKSQERIMQLPEPQIKAGIAIVYGKLNDPISKIQTLILRFQNPITADESIIETKVEKDGSFLFEAPIECSTVFSSIYSPGYGGVKIELSSDKDLEVEIKLDNTGKLKLDNFTGNNFLTKSKQNKEYYETVLTKYFDFAYPKKKPDFCSITPEEYVNYEMDMMKSRIDYSMNGAKFLDSGENFIINELKLLHLTGILLPYTERVEMFCYDKENWTPQEPDIQYYAFLKSFDLNNSHYIYSNYYSKMIQVLLSRRALNIPNISETPVEKWLMHLNATLSDLLGFDSGQFYDLLAANSYAKQFNDEVIPLSEIQINNIREYFGDSEISKILFRKNEEIIKKAGEKNAIVVNQTPDVLKEQLMNAIVSKYKNRVVLVDFWATWCVPCLDAMKQMDIIKDQYKNKNIVFVYITNGSSPLEIWDKKINSIPGEHYYVNADEWKYLMESLGFNGIPSYVIFDTKGKISNKFTSYPGSVEMQKMIEKLITE